MSRASAKTIALGDQVLAQLAEHGPMTTRELAEQLPAREWITCGHNDCTRPEHRRTYATHMHPADAYQVLARLHRRGEIGRTPLDSARTTMWWRL